MANSFTLLADLKAGRCSNTAEVPLLRFWEAINVRKGGELMSLDMFLIDENSTLMQGSVSAKYQLRFRNLLTQGSVYSLSEFDVTRSIPISGCPMPPSPYGSMMEPLLISYRSPLGPYLLSGSDSDHTISYLNWQTPANCSLEYIIGELNAIRSTITDRIPGAQRVMLTLRLQSGDNVCVSMFDSMALAFHSKFEFYGKEPNIVLATSVNPKIVGGRLFLNANSATHLYFDSGTAAGKEVFDSLRSHGADQTASSSKVVHAQKIEPLTIAELNQFIVTADSEITEFLCTAKVTGIQQDDGWCYIGCSRCSKKVIREISSFTCVSCNETNDVASLRYRVTLTVSNNTDTATFLAFDMEMAKLTNIQAS